MMGSPIAAGIRICPGCGIIAPFGRTSCSVCSTSFGATAPVAAGRLGPLLFACIHGSDFTCSACGKRSPLATIDIEGQVECMCCGLAQAFDAVQWTDALGHAHDVADLAGPNPDGQNPVPGRSIAGRSRHAKIGTEFTSSTKTQNSMIMDGRGTRTHSLRTTVSPGHPLCKTCRVPLEVALEPNGVTRTRCPQCNDGATYGLPPNASTVYADLRGIVAGEQRTDRPVARIARGQGGVEAVVCPQCGAALAAGDGEMVKCTFCSMTSRVPGKLARRQRQGVPPPMVPFWVLLDGLSPGRKKLLRGKSEDDDDDDDDDGDEGMARLPAGAGASPGARAPFMNPGAAPPWAHPNLHRALPPKGSMTGVIIAVAVVVVLLLGGLSVGAALYLQTDDDDPAPRPAAAPTAPAKKKR
jgi:hypothetical protein